MTLIYSLFIVSLIVSIIVFIINRGRVPEKKSLLFLVAVLVAVATLPWFFLDNKDNDLDFTKQDKLVLDKPVKIDRSIVVDSFETCVKAGFAVMESYPRKCSADGETFAEHIGNVLEKLDLIRLDTPRPNDKISSPLQISGEARGYWFFEGSFPVVLTNWDGLIIAEGFLSTPGEWMTEEFVPFSGELSFTTPDFNPRGSLILMKDNPSGLPEHDDALEIPVSFILDN